MVDVIEARKEKVSNMCICAECPSWIICGETGGFCANGKSLCISVEKGCICSTCPVAKKMGLKSDYYCTKGAAKSLLIVKKPEKKIISKKVIKKPVKKAVKKLLKKPIKKVLKKPVKKKSRK